MLKRCQAFFGMVDWARGWVRRSSPRARAASPRARDGATARARTAPRPAPWHRTDRSPAPAPRTRADNSTKGAEVWDLEAEAARLNLKLDEIPMEEKAWDRAVAMAYRKAALRAHPDKVPPAQREAAEANFKKLKSKVEKYTTIAISCLSEDLSAFLIAHLHQSQPMWWRNGRRS